MLQTWIILWLDILFQLYSHSGFYVMLVAIYDTSPKPSGRQMGISTQLQSDEFPPFVTTFPQYCVSAIPPGNGIYSQTVKLHTSAFRREVGSPYGQVETFRKLACLKVKTYVNGSQLILIWWDNRGSNAVLPGHSNQT